MDDTDRHVLVKRTMLLEATSIKKISHVAHFTEEQQVGVGLLHD